ncbi:CHAP domain-containing protein [Saccharopolyspora sp. CA-218241]|uniref:CHAP domain-containing protein n=1 Tax=Saccharopolyspora sp. CA-218241 TaxID=3240027 RepID=UPI003D997EDE
MGPVRRPGREEARGAGPARRPRPAEAQDAPDPAQQAAEAKQAQRERILQAARAEIGTKETGDNCSKYSEQCVVWCSLFAMEMWQQAGVDVDNEKMAFTGNVYTTGEQKGTAYGSDQLSQAQPGDVLLFGTSPNSASSSTHIAIVEKVNGDGTVTTIEGNTNGEGSNDGDGVYRKQRDLSADTFYGGVSPW